MNISIITSEFLFMIHSCPSAANITSIMPAVLLIIFLHTDLYCMKIDVVTNFVTIFCAVHVDWRYETWKRCNCSHTN